MVTFTKKLRAYAKQLNKQRKYLYIIALLSLSTWLFLKPQAFIDLWLTNDQQARILFHLGKLETAASKFTNAHWQAYSFYGSEKYDQAATIFSQFDDPESTLAQANALAHANHYVKARDLYQTILKLYPNHAWAKKNLSIIQDIIDQINLMSESQRQESGDSSKELGDEAQRADGADKQEPRQQKIEQLTADQLLLDPKLNEMWLRQVQKDPARFLSQKFYLQLKNPRKESNEPAQESSNE